MKFYDLAPADQPVPETIRHFARAWFSQSISEGGLDFSGDCGFVILHRCGESFYFLLPTVWRGSNEAWEAVFYKDASIDRFAPFLPVYPKAGPPRGAFCVWELGIVAHEARAWSTLLRSRRLPEDIKRWQADWISGEV